MANAQQWPGAWHTVGASWQREPQWGGRKENGRSLDIYHCTFCHLRHNAVAFSRLRKTKINGSKSGERDNGGQAD